MCKAAKSVALVAYDRLLLGCNHDSKLRAAAHHTIISLRCAFQREYLRDGANTGKSTEGKCVL